MNINAFTGRFVADPELRTTEKGGLSVVRFCLAVERNYQQAGEEKKVDFIDFVAWRGTADFISTYFKKGSMIAVVGELQTDTYTDKEGNKRKKYEVLVSHASFCGSKIETNLANASTAENEPSFSVLPEGNDDFLPFGNDDDLPFG